jgi:hypothetical protein
MAKKRKKPVAAAAKSRNEREWVLWVATAIVVVLAIAMWRRLIY